MHNQSLSALIEGLKNKSFSALELTEHFLKRIKSLDDKLNTFISLTEESAIAAAKAYDAAPTNRLLSGIPLAHKDIFCMVGTKTSCGSKMLDNFIAPYESTVTQKISAAGGICLGKTNMDEFAMGSSNETSYYGPAHNPWSLDHVPGGSSGGSAAAVAARLVPACTGTDTGGSIRQPAAYCGVTGIKPTYGLVSRWGMVAFASSLDQAGPIASSAEDAARLLNVMVGHDSKDATSLNRKTEDYLSACTKKHNRPLTIGLLPDALLQGLSQDFQQHLEETKHTLSQCTQAQFKTVNLPNIKHSISAYYVIAPAECSSNLSRFDGVRYGYRCQDPKDLNDLYQRSRGEGFGEEVKRRILMGTYALSAGYFDAYYKQAQKIRRLIKNDFDQAFESVDLILTPTTPSTAFKIGETTDPVSMYLNDIFTIPVNLAGLPAISFPAGFTQKLPVGMQLIGPAFSEAKLLNTVYQQQQETSFHKQMPEAFQ